MRARALLNQGGALLTAAFLMAALAGCATNPATGKSQLALISEAQEIQMGREADEQVVAQMGLYDDPELQRYVQQLGETLAARSERPNLPWTFRVVDDPVVNAFALPGGFIYVTRGIMAHMNSEAQLVSVLGHEIGHVTARHSVSQISKAQLASLGLGIGMIVEPGLQRFADLAQMGMQLMFLKFSRDDERQADGLGVRYMVRGGWSPGEMPDMFTVLQRVGEQAGAGRIPAWASTHPAPENRRERIQAEVASLNVDVSALKVEREGYYRRLDGMVFGSNPREGFFEEALFLHPEMEFQLELPPGWTYSNQRQAVTAVSTEQDAVILLTVAQQEDPAAAIREFMGQEGVQAGQTRSGKVNDLPAAWGTFGAETQDLSLVGRVLFLRYRDATFRILGYGVEKAWRQREAAVESTLGSFRRLTDPKALAVKPARLSLVRLDGEMVFEEFNSRFPSSAETETVAIINHLRPGDRVAAGALMKRVVGGPG